MKGSSLPKVSVVGSPVTALSFEKQIHIMSDWAVQKLSKVVCVANVHMFMEAYWHQDFKELLAMSDLVAPDGMPLVWMMRLLGVHDQDRVAGMDIFLALCRQASEQKISVCLVGSTSEVLSRICERLSHDFPSLKVARTEPLPFRPLTTEEDTALVNRINSSGSGIVFVALGCPKQECWMANHKDRIEAVMIGIGGVFPVFAGLQKWAPKWCRDAGLEWLYRLMQEPRRLWRRYGKTIPPFICLSLRQLVAEPRVREHVLPRLKP